MSKIYIDPGHGGDDIAAHGPTGLHEKDVVLAISKYCLDFDRGKYIGSELAKEQIRKALA